MIVFGACAVTPPSPLVFDKNLPQTLKGKSEIEIQKMFGEPQSLLIMNAVKPENSRALYIYLKGNSVIYAEYNEYSGYLSSDFFDVFMEDNKSLPK